MCADYNLILSSYDSTSCRNCASRVTRGELEFGTIGIDGSLAGKLVEIFNDLESLYIHLWLYGYNFVVTTWT